MAEHPDWSYHKETEKLNDFVECKTSLQEQKLCRESLFAIDRLFLGVSPNPKCCSLAVLLLNQKQCELHPSMPGKTAPPPDITVTHQPWRQVCLMNPIISCHHACRLTQAHVDTHTQTNEQKTFFCVCMCSSLTCSLTAPLSATFHAVTHLQLLHYSSCFTLSLCFLVSMTPHLSFLWHTWPYNTFFISMLYLSNSHLFMFSRHNIAFYCIWICQI